MTNLYQNNIPSNGSDASEIRDYVKNKIAMCIKKYMSLEETMTYLHNNHLINHDLTLTIWRNLEEENKDFFSIYPTRCLVYDQIKTYNDLLAKHVAMENNSREIISNPSPNSVLQHTEGTLVLETPNHQQNQIHHGQISQCNDPKIDKRYYYPRAPNVAVSATDQRSTDNDLPYLTGPPTTSLAATAPQASHALEFTSDTGLNNTNLFGCKNIDELTKLLKSDKEQEDQSGQWQQNFSTVQNQALDYGGNLLQDREINAQQQICHNSDQNQEMSHPEEHGLRTTQLEGELQFWIPELEVFEQSTKWW